MGAVPLPRQALLRASLAAAALLVAAWLAISLRDERLLVSGIRQMEEQPPNSAQAELNFRHASLLNKSQQPELFEASAWYVQGRRAEAIAMLQRLLADEPDNRSGWILLETWLRPADPRAADAAEARARELDGNY